MTAACAYCRMVREDHELLTVERIATGSVRQVCRPIVCPPCFTYGVGSARADRIIPAQTRPGTTREEIPA